MQFCKNVTKVVFFSVYIIRSLSHLFFFMTGEANFDHLVKVIFARLLSLIKMSSVGNYVEIL